MTLKLNRSLLKVSTFVFACLFMVNAQAGTLSSTLDQTVIEPDISAGGIISDYSGNSTSGIFTANGFASGLDNMGINNPITGSSPFTLVANIQKDAGTADGTLSIGGIISGLGFTSGTLLTGTLAQVGGPGLALNFIFNITGGDASLLYGGVGAEVGVIIGGSGYNSIASFNGAFDGTFGNANSFKVPVPNTLALFLMGFAALGLRRKLRA